MNSKQPQISQRKAFRGLVVRKECWTLSWRGRLVISLFLAVATFSLLFGAHPFLAVSKPVHGKILIVEGWVPPSAAREAKAIFERGHYQSILTCGGPVADRTGVDGQATYAEWGAIRLIRLGLSSNVVTAVSAQHVEKDRTYSSALAVKSWLAEHKVEVVSLDILTHDAHARRSLILFRKAFGPTVEIGVYSAPTHSYNPNRWWKSSDGVREIFGEGLAYFYALFFVYLW